MGLSQKVTGYMKTNIIVQKPYRAPCRRRVILFRSPDTLSDVVVDEGTLGVHQVELVIDAREDFGNSCAVRDPQERQSFRVSEFRVSSCWGLGFRG